MTQWLDIVLVFLFGGMNSWLSMRFRFSNAVAQVVLGVILGTAVLGWVPHSELLHDLGAIGVVLLLGVAGMELGLPRLKAGGWAGAMVALLGIAFSVGGQRRSRVSHCDIGIKAGSSDATRLRGHPRHGRYCCGHRHLTHDTTRETRDDE